MEKKTKLVKRNVKDSVFTNLFQDTKYVLQLYHALHPEETVTEDMIEIVTLKNILVDSMYNDLGFTIGNRLVVLVEAQSTWTANIIIRGLMYLVQTYQEYIEKEELNVYGSAKLPLPKPELYVIYTGEKKIRQGVITLSEEFFGGEESAVEVRVKVLCDGNQGDIIHQYVQFTRIYHEQMKKHGRSQEAIQETIRICKDEDVLKEYLSQHEKEVRDIMFSLFDDEYILDTYRRDLLKKGIKKGMEKGMEKGVEKGRQAGIREMIFKLFQKNKSDEDIQDMLDIPPEELQRLRTEYRQQ